MVKTKARSAFRLKLVSVAVASCFAAGPALANPTGANVVRGTAAIHQAGNLLQITNSPNAIINWQSFSIGTNEITRFIQRSPSSAVLNRVTTQDPSQILGTLQSRLTDGVTRGGKVFLINPNGIVFGQGSKIDVGGLVASTLNLSNEDFLSGRHVYGDGFEKGVVNQGSITTGTGGNVYLVGSDVANEGIIRSPKGEVVLAAGKSVELVNPGTPNLRVKVTASKEVARNLGQIVADAGRVGIYAGLINNSGTIRADSAVSEGGRIILKATQSVTLEDSSVLSAQGKGGGRIDVLADDSVHVAGRLDASAPNGGNGGFIETSAERVTTSADSVVTTAAPRGKAGTWLIDPRDLIINSDNITPQSIVTALEGGSDVTIDTLNSTPGTDGVGNISVEAPVNYNSPRSLTFIAHNDIAVTAAGGIDNSGAGSIRMFAGWNQSTGIVDPKVVPFTGSISLGAPIKTLGDVVLVAGNSVGQTAAGVITADGLRVEGSSVSLTTQFSGARNMVNRLAGRAHFGTFRFENAKALTIGDVAGLSGIVAGPGCCNALIDIRVTSGDLRVNRNVTAVAGNTDGVGSADVSLYTENGSIIVGNSAEISATGANAPGVNGSGGNASVQLNTTAGSGGSITVAGGSRIDAIGGNAATGSGSGGEALVTFISDVAITVDSSTVRATGGRGNGVEAQGGHADISLNANTGPLVVSNQSTLAALAGVGGNSGGGNASVSLSGNGISVSSSTLTATGGAGAGASNSGGSASVFLQGGAAVVAVAGSTIKATAGTGNQSGFGSVGIQTSSDMTISSSTISVDGSEGNINLQGSNVTMTNSSLSATSDGTQCCASTEIGVTATSISMTGTSSISANADGAEGGFIGLNASAGGIVLGRLATDAEGSINVSANGGSITDGNGATNNLQTPIASLFGSAGIGTIGNPLETDVGRINLSGGSGPIGVVNSGSLTVDNLFTSGSAQIEATGTLRTGSNTGFAGGGLKLLANGLHINRSLSTSGDMTLDSQAGNLDIVADGGEGVSVQGANIFLKGANVTVAAGALGQVPFSTSVVASDILSLETPGNVVVKSGNVSGANALVRGGVETNMIIGGTLQVNGDTTANTVATVEAGSPQTINLKFSGLSADGFSVNGILNAIEDNGSGFFVMGSTAVLNENMFVTYGGPPPFTDILTATMNQQVDVLADQLKAGDTGEGGEDKDKKKLPFCDG